MLRKLIVLISFGACSIIAHAQTDSIHFLSTKPVSQELMKGVHLIQYAFSNNDLFSANEYINIIAVDRKVSGALFHMVSSDSLEKTSQLAASRNAIAGINGSFFKMRGPDPDNRKDLNGVPKLEPSKLIYNRSVVYFRESDTMVAKNPVRKNNIQPRNQQGSIVINKGKLSIAKDDPKDAGAEFHLKGQDVISTGPLMILHNKYQYIPNDAFCNDRHPRTAVGVRKDGTVILLVVDGRATESAGMSIPELQHIMRWLNCVDAINFDGGGSSTMYVKGQPFKGVVNYPSDNKKFDHEGEREVANALLLLQR